MRFVMAGADWSSLPADLLRLVSDCLTSERDLLHVRHVCSHWRASAYMPVAPYRPWVVATRVCLPKHRASQLGEYSLWLHCGLRRIQLAGAPPGLTYCCGTPRGWLALADDEEFPTRLVLWEPRSGTVIPLPPLNQVLQVFLSADPLIASASSSSSSSSSGWMAAATQLRESILHNLFFWQPGDAAWSAADEVYANERLLSVEFHGGRMYCMDSLKSLAVYDLKLGTASLPVLLQGMYVVHSLNSLCIRRCGNKAHGGTRAAHFVTCNGELLLVVLFFARHPSFAEVYKFNLKPGDRKLEFGERIIDLGGYSIFLGRGDAFAISAQEFPEIKPNCVYYAVRDLNFDLKHWVFVFDLETDVLDELPLPHESKKRTVKQWWPISWFCPRRPLLC